MRATFMYGAGDVRVETVPDPMIQQPTDAIVRVVRACICGSDLHPYRGMPAVAQGAPMGHEFVGVVEDVGPAVRTLVRGDLVIAPFAWSDNTCDFCREGLHTGRTDLGREFGATDVVPERGEEGIAKVLELTGGDGTHTVLEAVGHMPAYDMAVGVVRAGGVISRVGVPQYEDAPIGFGSLFGRNITLTGGPAPVRAYIDELLPEVLDGRIEPGKVFDRTVTLEDVPDGYRAMNDREALKVLVRP